MKYIHNDVWRFAWPMIIANVTTPLLGLVDAAVLGHLPSPIYLGAVAIGASIFSCIYWSMGFFRMGTTGLVAQAYGARDSKSIIRILFQSIILAIVIGLVLILCAKPVFLLSTTFFQPSSLVSAELANYYFIRIYSAPAVLINFALLGWLIGMHKTRAPLYLMLLANSVNIVLDVFFVMGLGMTATGVALATVCADYLSMGFGLYLVTRVLREQIIQLDFSGIYYKAGFFQLLSVNRHLFFRSLSLLFCFAFFTAQGSRLGDTTLASNAILINFLLLISNGLDGFAHAAEALTGKAVGEKSKILFKATVRTTGLWSAIMAIFFLLVFYMGGEVIIALLTDIEEIKQAASHYLPWLIALPLVAVWSYWMDGVFIGLARTGVMQNTTIAATLCFFLPIWYLAKPLGNHGLWLAFYAFSFARSALMCASYYLLDKKQKLVVWKNE
ncbi:MATE family efflux transporter [Zooshikella marina]|uniref:MATE family efflux transporter n=1 Tax=Zooshikella ganghwensis TaxID=202772 RepID=UPI001BB04A21|nr:MATE family efflux transporter [Zooshikella ganghwensis]MBU2708259.1 MATE family efflux transporter [Zooshikella ganghwensis]